jgi:hypothetical protein
LNPPKAKISHFVEHRHLVVFPDESLEMYSQEKSLNMDVQDVQDAEQEKSDPVNPVHPCSKCFAKILVIRICRGSYPGLGSTSNAIKLSRLSSRLGSCAI